MTAKADIPAKTQKKSRAAGKLIISGEHAVELLSFADAYCDQVVETLNQIFSKLNLTHFDLTPFVIQLVDVGFSDSPHFRSHIERAWKFPEQDEWVAWWGVQDSALDTLKNHFEERSPSSSSGLIIRGGRGYKKATRLLDFIISSVCEPFLTPSRPYQTLEDASGIVATFNLYAAEELLQIKAFFPFLVVENVKNYIGLDSKRQDEFFKAIKDNRFVVQRLNRAGIIHEQLDSDVKSLLDKESSFAKSKRTASSRHIRPELTEKEIQRLSLDERLVALDAYARSNPDIPISNFVFKFLPEAKTRNQRGLLTPNASSIEPFPVIAPAFWSKDRESGETAVAFIKRVYAPWIENGLTRPALRKLDKPLYLAFAKWIERHPDWKEFELPTKPEMVDQWVERVAKGEEAPPSDYKERTRLQSAQQRRRD